MPYELNNKLVVGVSSSALFDLSEADSEPCPTSCQGGGGEVERKASR